MRKILFLVSVVVVIAALTLSGCTPRDVTPPVVVDPDPDDSVPVTPVAFDDGTYRGIYEDRGEQQVSIQFRLENGVLSGLSWRYLSYAGTNYRTLKEGEDLYPVMVQHKQILEYLDGKPLDTIADLYDTGSFVDDVDAYTGATIRGNKVHSAIIDGLNRGLYVPAGEFTTELPAFADGTYRGNYGDDGVHQVSIQFVLKEGVIQSPRFRHLFYRGVDYLKLVEGEQQYPVLRQHQQLLEYLTDKPVGAIFDLYTPAEFIDDIDAFTGATVRANKVHSAMRDALNRGLYSPAGALNIQIGEYVDGRYRGVYSDGGEQQVGVEFRIEGNTFTSFTFRHLYYSGVNYRSLEQGDTLYPVLLQHQQLAEYLVGQPLSVLLELYTPANVIDDVDAFTGATVRANKVFSAIMDGLNRGIY